MSTLRLFDVSQYIYSGVGNKQIIAGVENTNGMFQARSLPCAGITNVLNAYILFNTPDTDLIFCIDSVPTKKRKLYEDLFPEQKGYKGNRKKCSNQILIQLLMIEDILKQCGIRSIKAKGYEADDIIASIVENYANQYDKVYIHTRDSDLYYLVRENVEIVPVIKLGKHITLSNWEQTVRKDGELCFNTITLYKMLSGERGDNIPRADIKMMKKVIDLIPKSDYGLLGDNRVLREYIVSATDNDRSTVGIFDLIAPLILPEDSTEIYEEFLNLEVLEAYAIECGCKGYSRYNSLHNDVVTKTIDTYIDMYTTF